MKLFTIGDLHLSQSVDKPMDIFGASWEKYDEKIAENWKSIVGENDTVVIPGDISWGMTAGEALADLKLIDALPGKKILMKGNHDYWWQTSSKNNRLLNDEKLTTLSFLYNSSIYIEENNISICGTRGWKCPDDAASEPFSAEDEKIYLREAERLKLSLSAAREDSEIICFFHFPPFNRHCESNLFTTILEEHGVKRCFYGHLHGPSRKFSLNGKLPKGGDCEYVLVSADQLDFTPLKIV